MPGGVRARSSQTIAELESLDEESRERKLGKIRKQYIGHMFFIGALYKQGLLKENIMHHCVQELFGDPSEPDSEKLECLAKLLTSIGKKLDAAAGQEGVGQVHEGLLQAAQEARE